MTTFYKLRKIGTKEYYLTLNGVLVTREEASVFWGLESAKEIQAYHRSFEARYLVDYEIVEFEIIEKGIIG